MKKQINMNKPIFQTGIFLAIALLYGCNNDNHEPATDDKLPQIKSYVWSAAEGAPEQLAGLNEFDYDSSGRITLYSTPVQKTVYTYNGTKCNGIMTSTASGAKWQEQTLTFNKYGRPISEESTDFENGDVASVKYGYNDAGRLTKYEISLDDGRFKSCNLIYDDATGLVSEVRVLRHEAGGEDNLNLIYRYEYSNRKNPVALYPECLQIIDNEPAFGITGIDGYSRDLLPDKITMSLNGVDMQVFSFTYGFSEDGKLTSILETASHLDEKGNVVQSIPAIRITDIKY